VNRDCEASDDDELDLRGEDELEELSPVGR
jgi:hypothetical protein